MGATRHDSIPNVGSITSAGIDEICEPEPQEPSVLEGEEQPVEWDAEGNVDWKKEYFKAQAKLLKYTEAEVVGWQARYIGTGNHEPEGWFVIASADVDSFIDSGSYEVRALIVQPSEEPEE